MKYRKKPVVIDAMHFENCHALDVYQWIDGFEGEIPTIEIGNDHLLIHTLEGVMRADLGDYIIRGVNGEFYPCKADIFDKTYERVS